MTKLGLTGVLTTAIAFSTGFPLRAEAPLKISEVAPVGDLTAEVAVKLGELDNMLDTEEEFTDDEDKIRQTASLLACLAQAIAEHEKDSPLKLSAPDLRNAAIVIARAMTYEEAKKGLAAAKTTGGGEPTDNAPAEHDWAKLAKMYPLMEELNTRGAALRRALRRLRNPEEDSRHATDMAVIAVATYADTHDVSDPKDIAEWRAYAKELQEAMTGVAAAAKAKDKAKANELLKVANATCKKCHEKFNSAE